MLCCHCNKNEATRKYKQVKNGLHIEKDYCFDCYNRLFLETEEENGAESENALSACPYCGMTAEEFRAKKLVGCANCYKTLYKTVHPTLIKMQGKETHKGKFPMLENTNEAQTFEFASKDQIESARVERQSRELTTIIEKLKAEKNYKDAKEYADKLSRVRGKGKVEEDFVWRCSLETSKQS